MVDLNSDSMDSFIPNAVDLDEEGLLEARDLIQAANHMSYYADMFTSEFDIRLCRDFADKIVLLTNGANVEDLTDIQVALVIGHIMVPDATA
jgi:hypothetical protein